MTTADPINQRKLRQAIVEAFSESELRTLTFDLHIDYETLPPGSKVDKARELITRCLRESRIDELLSLCESARPRVGWQAVARTAVPAAACSFPRLAKMSETAVAAGPNPAHLRAGFGPMAICRSPILAIAAEM